MSIASDMLSQGIALTSQGIDSPSLEYSSDDGQTWTSIITACTWREKGVTPEFDEDGTERRRLSATLTAPYDTPELFESYLIRVAANAARIWAVVDKSGDTGTHYEYQLTKRTITRHTKNRGRIS